MRIGIVIFILIVFADLFLWWGIFGAGGLRAGDYFLNVGQGDSELVILPNGVRILTDAGPDASVVREIEKILPASDRYVDIAFISHPQADHYNGYNHLLDSVDVGAFVWNGRDDDPSVASWKTLLAKIHTKGIPMVTLARGDRIRADVAEDDILSPDSELASSAELNDTGLVELIKTPNLKTLFTADTGMHVEQFLLERHSDVRADILKVAHHGSKFSTSDAFLRAVNPSIVAIEVGANNTYGHPASSTLARIASSTHAFVFRTDKNGTIFIGSEGGKRHFGVVPAEAGIHASYKIESEKGSSQ